MDPEDRFWELAEPLLLTRVGVTRSTMMGFPCLRINGGFFASLDRKNGQLVGNYRRRASRELFASGATFPFPPAGRTFREWAAIPSSASDTWPALLEEALAFVASAVQSRSRRGLSGRPR